MATNFSMSTEKRDKVDLFLQFVPGLVHPNVVPLPKVPLIPLMLLEDGPSVRDVPLTDIVGARANATGQVELQVCWAGYDKRT
ncbi:MAG: hypothetical protein P4L81_02795 [Candidatus Pacebacteria bacterium]|nr:hypothetical protein [Candidatus Paceibacterota bacterium]